MTENRQTPLTQPPSNLHPRSAQTQSTFQHGKAKGRRYQLTQKRQQNQPKLPIRSTGNKSVCRPNAIVYLAQKGNHTSYDRDSFGLLQRSLDLLYQNYVNQFHATTQVIIFHTGDFTDQDQSYLENLQAPHTRGTLQLIRISGTPYWQLPNFLEGEGPEDWLLPDYSVGYRHMMRWYAVKLYEYLRDVHPCNYKYIMRMDEESFLLSKIDYNVFEFMSREKYQYAYRMCSFELQHMKPLWREYKEARKGRLKLKRPEFLVQDLCGFYNNWFILELDWIFTAEVQDWLQWIDDSGYIYRKRINDLVIHTAAVYAFLNSSGVHRFLDFTYQHFTSYKDSGCPLWGALGGGYNDATGLEKVERFWIQEVKGKGCPAPTDKKLYHPRLQNMTWDDLSPTYQHVSNEIKQRVKSLPEVAAGRVDLQDIGIRSG